MSIKRDLLKEKLFDRKAYNTIYINVADEERVKKEQMETLVELICDDKHKSGRGELFNFLKKEPKAVDLLMRAIGEATGDKSKLIAACWEADLDCDRYVGLFVDVILSSDDISATMEALTAIQNMRMIAPAEAEGLINKIKENMPKQMDAARDALIQDLVETLRKWQQ